MLTYGGAGLLAGVATGALIWPFIASSSCRPNAIAEQSGGGCAEAIVFDGGKRREGMLLFGAIGALAGTIVGAVASTPRWEVIPHDGLTITVASSPTKMAIEGIVRF